MKYWKVIVVFLAVGAFAASVLWHPESGAQKAVAETRRGLRQQGFKVDLAEFDLTSSAEMRARATALTNAAQMGRVRRWPLENLDLMMPAGSNTALVVWKEEKLTTSAGDDLWPALKKSLEEDRVALDEACAAALAGPIQFNLDTKTGSGMRLPHLPALKTLTQKLGIRAMLELHEGNREAAWTNLLAATRCVTAWNPEPVEMSHLLRQACAAIAYRAAWQVLQAGDWSDAHLDRLQREWASVDFFSGLPETMAFTRACMATLYQRGREERPETGLPLRGMIQSPRSAWPELREYWRRARYRHQGTFEDERAILLYYRDRELQFRGAVRSTTWLEMRQLPGVTNVVPFQSKHSSRIQSLMNMKQIRLNLQGRALGLFGRAAEAETRWRLLLTAIALERYRIWNNAYPGTLQQLGPELLRSLPHDFMDGRPLRYRLTEDGHFVLYSVGLDGTDDGGTLQQRRPGEPSSAGFVGFGIQPGTDLVWPRPASATEAKALQEE